MEELKAIEKKMKELRNEKRMITAKDRWSGMGGIWHTFRSMGRTYYNDKALDTVAKKARLKANMEKFITERL